MRNRLIFTLLFFILSLIFLVFIPEDIMVNNSFKLALLGSVLSFLTLLQIFSSYGNVKEIWIDKSELKNKWYRKMHQYLIIVSALIFFGLAIHYNSVCVKSLQNVEMITKASVINKRISEIKLCKLCSINKFVIRQNGTF